MNGPPEGVYEGRASEYRGRKGEDVVLEDAFLDAYEKGMAKKPPRLASEDPYTFEVVGIFIEGRNPPSDYRVRIKDHPG